MRLAVGSRSACWGSTFAAGLLTPVSDASCCQDRGYHGRQSSSLLSSLSEKCSLACGMSLWGIWVSAGKGSVRCREMQPSGTSAGGFGPFPDLSRSRGNVLNCCRLLSTVPLLSWPWTAFCSLFDGTHTGFLCHSRNCRQEISGIISRDLTDKKVVMAKNRRWDSCVTETCSLNLFITKWAQWFSFPFFVVAVEKRWRDGDCYTYTQNEPN